MDFLGKLIEMVRKLIGNPKLNISCLFISILFYYFFSKAFFLGIIVFSVVLIVEFGFFLKEKHNANKISDFYDAFNAQGKYIDILKEIEKKITSKKLDKHF